MNSGSGLLGGLTCGEKDTGQQVRLCLSQVRLITNATEQMVSITRHLFLTLLEVRSLEIQLWAELVSPKACFLGLQTAIFSLCPHMVIPLYVCALSLLIKTPVKLNEGPP